jgi:hypothetical protein
MKPIEKIWQELIGRGRSDWPVYQRVDDTHPIDFYAGIGADGTRVLMLISAPEPAGPPSYHAFEVIKARRNDGRWTVTVELRRSEFSHVFGHLCDDLISAARTESTPDDAANFLIARIHRWQKLLSRERTGLLSIEEIRGLIGELLFLQKMCSIEKHPDAAVRSWEGPLDAPQDFRLADRFVEVKTCGPSNLNTWISSEDQLDQRTMPIVLSVAVVEPSDSLAPNSFTLSNLVTQLHDKLSHSRTALEAFEEKIKLTGYVDRQEYTQDCFAFREFRHFAVQNAFPRLARSLLPEAIVSVRYQLDLSKCRSFERESPSI